MKIRPEQILYSRDELKFKKIFVTGSDEVLIDYLCGYLINLFEKKNYFIDVSSEINMGLVGDLFSDKKVLFFQKNIPSKIDFLDHADFNQQAFLFSSPNNKKNTILKNHFLKHKDSLVVDCYALNKKSKETALKMLTDEMGINFSSDVFWYCVENLEDNYVILKQQIQTISLLKSQSVSIKDVERLLFLENNVELSKMFFYIFKNNNILINLFNRNILSISDFYIFLNSLKRYLQIISGSTTKEDALFKFPKYLFGEKEIFLKIYNSLKKNGLVKIYSNLFRAESLIRKNPGMYSVVGLRLFLNIKKVITS